MGFIYGQEPCPSPSLSGKLTYDNLQNTPLSSSVVYLKTPLGITTDSSTTDQNGNYRFCNIPYGSYYLTATTNIQWGGVNAADALRALQHFVPGPLLTGLRYKAGDVNISSYINASDALAIAKRYTQIMSSFISDDWVFEDRQVTITDTITQAIDLKGLCSGDVDGSYIPAVQNFFTCGDTLIDQRDMQKYPTVKIGGQCWMQKNLNIGQMVTDHHYMNMHSHCSNNGIIEKYCYNNDMANCAIYGGLYDWNEMMDYDTLYGTQGICPEGWHVPTNDDWCTLMTYLDTTVNCTAQTYSGTTIGGKIKEAGTSHWKSPNTGATNESGFTSTGNGNRAMNGGFGGQKLYGPMWSSSVESINNIIYCWSAKFDENTIGFWAYYLNPASDNYKTLGGAVRCIKDN